MNIIQNVLKAFTTRCRFVGRALTLAALVAGVAPNAWADQLAICDDNNGNDSDSAHPLYDDFIRTGVPSGECQWSPGATCWTGPNWANGVTYTAAKTQTCRSGSVNTYYVAVLSFGNLRGERTVARPHWYTIGYIYDQFGALADAKAGPADSLNWSSWMAISAAKAASAYSVAGYGYIY
jgi:hypothetical protein